MNSSRAGAGTLKTESTGPTEFGGGEAGGADDLANKNNAGDVPSPKSSRKQQRKDSLEIEQMPDPDHTVEKHPTLALGERLYLE